MSQEQALLPCPFCGSLPLTEQNPDGEGGEFTTVTCSGDCILDNTAISVVAWNRRPDAGNEDDLVEAADDKLNWAVDALMKAENDGEIWGILQEVVEADRKARRGNDTDLRTAAEKFLASRHIETPNDVSHDELPRLLTEFASTVANKRLGWVPIRSEDDLPKKAGDNLWLRRDRHESGELPMPRWFEPDKPWMSVDAIVRTYEARLPIPPYKQGETE